MDSSFKPNFKFSTTEQIVEAYRNPHFTVYDTIQKQCDHETPPQGQNPEWDNNTLGHTYPSKPRVIPQDIVDELQSPLNV